MIGSVGPRPHAFCGTHCHNGARLDGNRPHRRRCCDYCPAPGIVKETLRLAGRRERGPLNGDAVAIVTGIAFYSGFENQGTDLASPLRSQASVPGLC